MSPKIYSVSLFDQPFSRYRPFWDNCTEWPQIDLAQYKVKLPYICITSVRDSQISLRFALRPALFETQAILRQVHQMTSNWPWTLQRQITLYLYNNCPWVSNFTLFHSTTSRFGVTGQFETHAPNDLKMTLNTTRWKVHHICVTTVPESQKRTRKKCQKSKIWNFTILYTTLIETLLMSITEFCGANLLCTFRQDVV